MSTNVIKQIVSNTDNSQTIRMIVRSNERGPRGPRGETGLQGPQGIQGPRGFDGAIQYHAGPGIVISEDNMIAATGEAVATWGGILGDITDQTDLQNEFGNYTKTSDLATVATSGDYDDLTDKPTIGDGTLTIQSDGTTVGTFTANSGSNVTANVIPPVRVGSVVSEPTDVAFVDTVNIVDGAVTAAKVDFGTFPGNYSTSEADTGYTWVDGKHIYKKTVYLGELPNNTTKTVLHGISNIDLLIKLDGNAYRTNDHGLFPLPYISNSESLQIGISLGPADIFIGSGSDRTNMVGWVTLYYTKTS